MTAQRWLPAALAALAVLADAGPRPAAAQYSGTEQSTRLYTAPDPSATGGLRGRIASPAGPAYGVYAINASDPAATYKAELGDEGRSFSFRGLPVGRYDLMVVYRDGFFEGCTLHRGEDSLRPEDRASIETSINRSVPFFDTKQLHRLAGETGREGKARGVLQEVRTRFTLTQAATELKDIQPRSIKIALLENAGIGWQLVRTREIVRMEAGPGDPKGIVPGRHLPELGGLRVTDTVRDLGALHLR